jgi:hypothetical protein
VAFSIPVTTSGPSAVPPAALPTIASMNSLTLATRSVRRSPTPPVLGDRGVQRLGSADRGADRMPAVGEDLGQARPDHGGVLGDDDPHSRVADDQLRPPAGAGA